MTLQYVGLKNFFLKNRCDTCCSYEAALISNRNMSLAEATRLH